jgi:transposase
MEHFAGLDVSVKDTSVCIVDDTGKIVREVKVASEPEALLAVLKNPAYRFKRIGLEAGPLSQWLFSALAEAGLPVICVETRHMRAALKAQINKTDRNDARGIAQMMRVGLYRPVHVKTLRSQKLRMLLTHRQLLQSKVGQAPGAGEARRQDIVVKRLKGRIGARFALDDATRRLVFASPSLDAA